MKKKYLNQNEFDKLLYTACNQGDLVIADKLLNTYYLKQQKTHLNSFLSICGLGHPVLRLTQDGVESFREACTKGHKDIIELFFGNEIFWKQENNLYLLLTCFTSSLINGHIEISDLIIPHIKTKERDYYTSLINVLLDSCENNQLKSVKYIFENKNLQFNNYGAFYSELEEEERGPVVHRVVAMALYSNSNDILHYFAFELNDFYKKDFLTALDDNKVNMNALQKIQDYKELKLEIDTSKESQQKRLKI